MYTTIDELITDNKNMVEIDNSVEKRLLQHMEKYMADVEHNETQAYNYATQIILNCLLIF